MIGTAGCYSRAILAIIENKTAMFQNIGRKEKMIARMRRLRIGTGYHRE